MRDFGLRGTYHLDTFGGCTYLYDANPKRPYTAAEIQEANFELVREFRRHGIDLTSETLSHVYVPWIGHVWALFNYAKTWEGEEWVPFANFIYHGAISWNSGHGGMPCIAWYTKTPSAEDTIVAAIIQGGGAAFEYTDVPMDNEFLLDILHLVQPPYQFLRNLKWTDYRRDGDTIRVVYAGKDNYIEASVRDFSYRVVVDGVTIGKNFVTVYPGPRPGTLIAYSRDARELDWPSRRDGRTVRSRPSR